VATVISFTRRSDGPANAEQLDSFLAGLESGEITYAHPRFAQDTRKCAFSVDKSAASATVISWRSKDFSLLMNRWPAHEATLNKFCHHFSFCINGRDHSAMEPGLESKLEDRVGVQLPWIVNKCIALGQNPNASIMIKVDPITVYMMKEYGERRFDNTGHIPYLCEMMKAYNLTRMHVSFVQFDIGGPELKRRLRALFPDLVILNIGTDEKLELLAEKVIPFTKAANIEIQTCTAIGLVKQGACVGWDDIDSITKGRANSQYDPRKITTVLCTCYPYRDVGDVSKLCKHECRYCPQSRF
jgi:hypothetical protein